MSKTSKEIWLSRNPVHETNLDTGEDMFWKTLDMCFKEFSDQESSFKDKRIGELESELNTGANQYAFVCIELDELEEQSSSKDARIKEMEERLETAEKVIGDAIGNHEQYGYLTLETERSMNAFLTNKTE
jgi:predicted  nucleic acid-binding Zn-ribbon protein